MDTTVHPMGMGFTSLPPMARAAYELASKWHHGQTRRDKVTPYICHIHEVMRRVDWSNEEDLAVAAAHDLAEDANITVADLRLAGLSSEVIDGVLTLTKGDDEAYDRFILRIKTYRSGRWVRVKVCDILANLSDAPTLNQIRKYAAALLILTEGME